MQYWINHKGVQSGPVDLDALKEMGLTSAAYVWHEGLSDWVKITQLPELQGLYEMVGEPIPEPQAVTTGTPIEETTQGTPIEETTQAQIGSPLQPQCGEEPLIDEPCPSTNLVTKLYKAGDLYGAKSASETSMWWTIAAIVVGVVWRPLLYTLICA